MANRFDLIAFDADDTLWHEQRKFEDTEERVIELLGEFTSAEKIRASLRSIDVRNLQYFGYGVKGFVLSMIEAAIDCTDRRVTGKEIEQIIGFGRDMLDHPIECFPHVETTLANLALSHTLMIITKGDLLDQETKIARSGLARYFDHIEIVSNKKPATYAALLQRYQVEPRRFLMVGNALRSDILPVVEVGGNAIHIPTALAWLHEHDEKADQSRFITLDHIGEVIGYVQQLENS